jgi:hypothetical protein
MSNEEFLAWRRRCGDILDAAANEATALKQTHLGMEALFVAMLGWVVGRRALIRVCICA